MEELIRLTEGEGIEEDLIDYLSKERNWPSSVLKVISRRIKRDPDLTYLQTIAMEDTLIMYNYLIQLDPVKDDDIIAKLYNKSTNEEIIETIVDAVGEFMVKDHNYISQLVYDERARKGITEHIILNDYWYAKTLPGFYEYAPRLLEDEYEGGKRLMWVILNDIEYAKTLPGYYEARHSLKMRMKKYWGRKQYVYAYIDYLKDINKISYDKYEEIIDKVIENGTWNVEPLIYELIDYLKSENSLSVLRCENILWKVSMTYMTRRYYEIRDIPSMLLTETVAINKIKEVTLYLDCNCQKLIKMIINWIIFFSNMRGINISDQQVIVLEGVVRVCDKINYEKIERQIENSDCDILKLWWYMKQEDV